MPDISQEIQKITSDIQKKYAPKNTGVSGGYDPNLFKTVDPNAGKLRFQDYSTTKFGAYHDILNSGEVVATIPNYMVGTDNNERLAQQESTGEKWKNGLIKFAGKTGTAVLGGTIGTVYGAVDAIKEGSFDALYDNSFSRTLDDWNTQMDYNLPNYVTEQERNENFGQSLFNANFWANDVLAGASFTFGAIISEGLWATATGGASLAGTASRYATKLGRAGKWGAEALGAERVANGLFKMKGLVGDIPKNFMLNSLNKTTAITAGKAGSFLNNSRFLATSAGYEAGTEAYQYKKEAKENFFQNFKDLNGREPDTEDIEAFNLDLENSANAVFAGNLGILAPSNAVMYGTMFGMKTPFKGLQKSVDKTLFGLGVEETAGSFRAIQATKAQRVFSGVYSATKPIVTEALWEEGGQSVVSKTAKNWIESAYNPKYNGATMDKMEAMYEALGETFSTKEGWKEIGIGAIIGAGASLVQGRGLPEEYRAIEAERKTNESVASQHNKYTVGQDITARRIMMDAKVQNAIERQTVAQDKGDYVEAELSQQDVLLGEIEFRHDIGEDVSVLVDKYSLALDNVSNQEWADAGIKDPQAYKTEVLSAYSNLTENYKKNIQFAEAIYGGQRFAKTDLDTHTAKQALAYVLTKGEVANQIMDSSLQEMGKVVGQENMKSLMVSFKLEALDKETRSNILTTNKQIKALQNKQNKLVKTLTKLQNAPKETEGDTKRGDKLGAVTEELTRVEQELTALQQTSEEQAQALSQESVRRTDINDVNLDASLMSQIISSEDLQNIDLNLTKLDRIIAGYKGYNPQIYSELITLADRYNKSKNSFLDYQVAALGLASGKVKIKSEKVGGFIGKAFNPKTPMTEFTQNYLQYILDQRIEGEVNVARDFTFNRIGGVPETVTESEMTNPITEDRITIIASKNIYKEPLSDRELELQRNNQPEITKREAELLQTVGSPILNPDVVEIVDAIKSISEVETLKQTLNDALNAKYKPLSYIGTDADELVKARPSQEDIDKYRELDAQRSADEEQQYLDLRTKLGNWRLLNSVTYDGQTMSDTIELINQLETIADQKDTVSEITSEELPLMTEDTFEQTSDERTVYDIAQNTSSNVTVKADKNGNLLFAHMDIRSLASKLNAQITIKTAKGAVVNTTPENLQKYRVQPGTIFILTSSESPEGVNFTVGQGARLQVEAREWLKVAEFTNLMVVDTGNAEWTWKDVYEFNGVDYTEKPSDFTDDNITGDGYTLNTDDSLDLFVDLNDGYTQSQLDAFDKGSITKEQLRDSVKIFVRQGLKNFATLKANRTSINPNFLEIRNVALDAVLTGLSSKIGSVKVSHIFKGSPKLNIDAEGTAVEHNFNDNSIKEVKTVGYMQDGILLVADKTIETKTDVSFVKGISESKKGMKVPLIVVKKADHFIAYPISMIKTPNSQEAQLDLILSNEQYSEIEMVKAINSLLLENGVSPSRYNLINLEDEVKMEGIRAELSSKVNFRTADDLLKPEYNISQLKLDATINIDLEDLDRSISSPKIRFDLDNVNLIAKKDWINDNKTEIEQKLSEDAIAIDRSLNNYTDTKGDPIEDAFTDVFADNEVQRKPQNNLENIQNLNILAQAMQKITPRASKFIGKEKIAEIKGMLERLDFIRETIKVDKDSQFTATQTNLNC